MDSSFKNFCNFFLRFLFSYFVFLFFFQYQNTSFMFAIIICFISFIFYETSETEPISFFVYLLSFIAVSYCFYFILIKIVPFQYSYLFKFVPF